ncbi:class I SAM-dependent methyltransferase [Pseudaestuariivita atlantica]|uniref:Methyltransferase n=1 Tax=Pseudaestuariivita atlantica TaxID=1317121 RepID=A0A0L1JU80_9RHOB|nr:class I SAM-dependent methyltransferase [Pseudaestuariivita atlantica]KNG95326.1 methyltransferase [Pseudaestuariivita atlantica]
MLKRLSAATRRRARRKALPRAKLDLSHTQGGTLLPDRLHLLDVMPKGARVAEIGVAQGNFSTQILERCTPQVLHLVDAWHTTRYRPAQAQVEKRFASEIAAGQVVLHPGLSTDRLPEFADASLDWAYIDTDHSYPTTKAELEICDRVVAPGGLIAGHDFCTGNTDKPTFYGVVQAVNEFCVTRGWRYRHVTLESGAHFSFCLERIA